MSGDKVVRDETRTVTVHTVVSVRHVDSDPLGTFGWFIDIRTRGGRDRAERDRRRYGKCVICAHAFTDDEQIHMVGEVVRNGKRLGNRLCCSSCASQHATYHRLACDPTRTATAQ